jgi:hypothetical protein
LLGGGCGTARLDAGSNAPVDAGEAQGHVWSGTPSNAYNLPCDVPAPDWLAGKWSGTFDVFSLRSGSKSVEIDVKGSYLYPGGVCGTVTFGNGPPLPLPTDAASPPPGLATFDEGLPGRVIREGFPYEFYLLGDLQNIGEPGVVIMPVTPQLAGQRVRFPFDVGQYFNAWCNMQPSYQQGTGTSGTSDYACVPPGEPLVDGTDPTCSGHGGDISGPTYTNVSCAQAAFCKLNLCYCTGPLPPPNGPPEGVAGGVLYGCQANSAGHTSFDVTVSNDAMTGSVILFESVETLHLTRVR